MGRAGRITVLLSTLVVVAGLALVVVGRAAHATADRAADATTAPSFPVEALAGLSSSAMIAAPSMSPVAPTESPPAVPDPAAPDQARSHLAAASAAGRSRTPTPSTTATQAPSTTSTVDRATVAHAVTDAVEQAAAGGITEHVVVLDRSTGQTITSVGADLAVPSMSLVKLFIATDAIAQAGGVDQLADTDRSALTTMIEQSDDEIAQDYYDADGGDDIVERTAARYGLTGTAPSPEPEYWGDVQVTAADLASFLRQALADPQTGPFLTAAMNASAATGSDGFDQRFGVHALSGTGSKQGWGCCLGGVLALHSVGYSADRIVVVLSTAVPDAGPDDLADADQLMADPGVAASTAAVTATARAAFTGAPPTVRDTVAAG